jgi:hypothetical protein
MLGRVDGWNSFVSMTLISSISKERKNKVVDALSRRVHEVHATTISMYQTHIKGRISEAENADL